MGLDVYLSDGSSESPRSWGEGRVSSAIHPDHYFTPFYLRSSYNGSGFDRVVGEQIKGGTLWDIFAPCGDLSSGSVRPTKTALREARANAVRVREEFTALSPVAADFVRRNPFDTSEPTVTDGERAIAIYRQEAARERHDMGSYGNNNGDFYLDKPMKVRAAIPGTGFGGEGVYLIYEIETEFYSQALDIVVEFIDNALTMKRPKIVWSY
jgi:hypothetical protein